MTNFRFQMRKVATVVACLVVTTMFASCDKKNPDDDENSSGKNDKKLVGVWQFYMPTYNRYYIFNKDGSFSYSYHSQGSSGFFIEGKYTASDKKVFFKDFVYEGIAELTISKAEYEYEIGSDEQGVYLKMAGIRFNEPYVDISWAVKFRKD